MKYFLSLLVIIALTPPVAHAEDYTYSEGFPCGLMSVSNSSAQFGPNAWIQYIVRTTGSLDVCGQWIVWVTANVPEVNGSAANAMGLYVAEVKRQVPVPSFRRAYTTNGTHTATTTLFFVTLNMSSSSIAEVGDPPAGGPGVEFCDPSARPESSEPPNCESPLVFDTAGDGFALTSPADGVSFDINADGVPEQIAWTRPDSDDAFLAYDRNGNGVIDSGAELFGQVTPIETGSDITSQNGFEALKFLELPSYGPSERNWT